MSDEGFFGSSPEERIERLERRSAEMEALVKGLTDEILDLKAVVMKLKKDQRPAPVIQAVAPPAPSRNKTRGEEDEPGFHASGSAQQVQQPREKITLKMQPDGTLAPDKEYGDDIIIASPRDVRQRGKDAGDRNRGNLIIADDVDPSEQK
jgi:hypothetical protein